MAPFRCFTVVGLEFLLQAQQREGRLLEDKFGKRWLLAEDQGPQAALRQRWHLPHRRKQHQQMLKSRFIAKRMAVLPRSNPLAAISLSS